MPPSNDVSGYSLSSEEQGVDPLRPVEHLIQWGATIAIQLTIGLLLGLLAARLMRSRHLHWSWAVVGFGLVALARAPLASTATTLAAGALVAAVRGRSWHEEDLEAGADLAEIALERRHPLGAVRAGLGAVRTIALQADSGGFGSATVTLLDKFRKGSSPDSRRSPWLRGDQLVLGADRHGGRVSIDIGGTGGGVHTLVVGATGSGKTVTQAWIATQTIASGMAAVVVDPKGDRALRAAVRGATLSNGRRFIEWTPAGPTVYNPYARGGETEIADKALAAERFTEPHYQRQAQRYLGHVVRALRHTGREVSLGEIVRLLEPGALETVARGLPRESSRAIHDYLDSLTTRQRTDLSGVRDRLAIAVESDVGSWLDPATDGAERFDLLGAINERAVVYFDLQADSRPLLAEMLGGAIVQDLQTAIGAMQACPVPTLVLLDEFSALAAGNVARLFARARSAGFSLLLGTQELSDLRLHGREYLLEQVLGNLTSLIAHRQVVPASAELTSRLAGTRGAWQTAWGRDRRGMRKRVLEPQVSPEQVASLERGQAAVIRLAGRTRVAVVHVLPPGVRL